MSKLKPVLYGVATLLALLLVLFGQRWLTDSTTKEQSVTRYKSVCDVAQGCRIQIDGHSVLLNILPASLPAMEPLQLSVTLEGLKASSVSLEFAGRDMPMALPPVSLYQQGESDTYTGIGSLSFCTVDKNMVWLARLIINTTKDVKIVDFELQSMGH